MPKRLLGVIVLLNMFCLATQCFADGAGNAAESRLGFANNITVETVQGAESFVWVGEAERSFLFFDVYNIAFYRGVTSSSSTTGAELLYLAYERALSKEKVRGVLREGLVRNLVPEKQRELSVSIEELLESIHSDLNEGDYLIIIKRPEGDITVLLNGQSIGLVSDLLLAEALWNIWAGEGSVVDRRALFQVSHH